MKCGTSWPSVTTHPIDGVVVGEGNHYANASTHPVGRVTVCGNGCLSASMHPVEDVPVGEGNRYANAPTHLVESVATGGIRCSNASTQPVEDVTIDERNATTFGNDCVHASTHPVELVAIVEGNGQANTNSPRQTLRPNGGIGWLSFATKPGRSANPAGHKLSLSSKRSVRSSFRYRRNTRPVVGTTPLV
jgi:hypothetical protein